MINETFLLITFIYYVLQCIENICTKAGEIDSKSLLLPDLTGWYPGSVINLALRCDVIYFLSRVFDCTSSCSKSHFQSSRTNFCPRLNQRQKEGPPCLQSIYVFNKKKQMHARLVVGGVMRCHPRRREWTLHALSSDIHSIFTLPVYTAGTWQHDL